MSKEYELVKRLINLCLDYETELQVAHRVLATIRLNDPSLPVLETLDFARKDATARNAAEAKFRPLLDTLEAKDLMDLLNKFPQPRYEN